MIKRIRNTFLILLLGVLAGALLLTLVFCLPVDRARQNVKASLYPMLEIQQDENGSAFRKGILEQKENFTDSLMVQNALEKIGGKSPFSHAMYVYHSDLTNEKTWSPEESMPVMLEKGSEGMYLLEYSRYWHGYLIFLKPLLMMITWEQVEYLGVALQLLLLAAVVAAAVRRKQTLLGIGIVVTFFFMKPVPILVSLAMSVCWYITLTAILIELLLYDRLQQKQWFEAFFLIVGMVTAYMDFLTYPIVTLGLPLCTWLILNLTQDSTWKKRFQALFWMAAAWGIGYLGMWGMKWVVADLTLHTGTLKEAAWAIIQRTEPLDGYASAASGVDRTLALNLAQYDSPVYLWVMAMIAAAAIVCTVCAGYRMVKDREQKWLWNLLFFPAIALLPFIWFVGTQNHSAIHCIFTFRILGVTVFSVWCMGICCLKVLKNKKK